MGRVPTELGTPAPHLGMPGLESHLNASFLIRLILRSRGWTQVGGLLPPTWGPWMERLPPGFSPCRCLGSELVDAGSLSLSDFSDLFFNLTLVEKWDENISI